MADEKDDAVQVDEAIRRALLAIEDGEGRLTPAAVVAAAENPDSPLHPRFEWDDSKAAHAFRLEQARRLIRGVQVVITTEDRVISTVHYVHDPRVGEDEQGYVSLSQLRSEPGNARAMLRVEFARAAACLRRAEDLADALGLRREVAAAARKVEAVRRKIEAKQIPAAAPAPPA